MKKKMRAVLSLVLALTMCLSLSVSAFAETVPGTVEVETTAGKNETVDVTITIENTTNANGTTTTESTTEAKDFVTGDGMTVDYSGSATEIKDAEGNLLPGSSSDSSWNAVNGDGSYTSEGGSDSKVTETSPNGTVNVPTKEGESDSYYGRPEGSVTTGDTDKSDGIYDYTTETVKQQGSITVETGKVEVSVDKVESNYESDLEHVKSDAVANADNDLMEESSKAKIPGEGDTLPSVTEGFDFIYIGTDNASQFWSAHLYKTPGYEGEPAIYTDENGQSYYSHHGVDIFNKRTDCVVEGFYINGELVEDRDNKFGAVYSSIEQYVILDAKTGKVMTTYCADQNNPAQNGYGYNMENIEDADYYTEEQAAMIRTVALNGYWGTKSGTGSLEAVKQMMRDAKEDGKPVFTEEEINALTDGIAMTATQYAIWSFSNYMDDVVFVNAHYMNKTEANKMISGLKDIPEGKEASVDLLFKLYNHLVNMDPTTVEDPDTTNTVITKDNFIKDMSVTVIEKAEEHANNTDDNDKNDAYVTDLSFALVVTPSTENGDDMIVQVIGSNGVIAEARIAGVAKEGETMQYLTPDENGNFIFSGITMIEGNQNFNITLQGIQNLEKGVYLYSSEVKSGVSSQTMVGIAEGEHAVNVSMDISFNLNVEDEIVASEHVWRTEWDPGNTPPEWNPPVPLNEEPEEEIIEDEPVPLAQAPATGGISTVFAIAAAVSGMGLAGIAFIGKRRDEE
ncbi:MAG: Cys-Gln thioester bond-forming surface protein [Oscillospiraceae bacterium]|nr:Cys-Gln thioester bond-forming surface protein [Oscillospiraceae bacterium]